MAAESSTKDKAQKDSSSIEANVESSDCHIKAPSLGHYLQTTHRHLPIPD
jgi:hypothetical protein